MSGSEAVWDMMECGKHFLHNFASCACLNHGLRRMCWCKVLTIWLHVHSSAAPLITATFRKSSSEHYTLIDAQPHIFDTVQCAPM